MDVGGDHFTLDSTAYCFLAVRKILAWKENVGTSVSVIDFLLVTVVRFGLFDLRFEYLRVLPL